MPLATSGNSTLEMAPSTALRLTLRSTTPSVAATRCVLHGVHFSIVSVPLPSLQISVRLLHLPHNTDPFAALP